ncbi:MAG: signal peptidase I [Candidatus Sumerlaeota bacterium]|nr:signal peptidase I [Candidatus Sumerlaeota bacterium]
MDRTSLTYKRVTWLRFTIGMAVFLPLLAFLLALRFGLIRNYEVTSSSMAPTLQVGDRVFMDRESANKLARRDVIVLANPKATGELLTKRVIGLPGDTIEVRHGYLYVDGQEQIEMYISPENRRIDTPDRTVALDKDHLFVLGDNRNSSYDSLEFGPAPLSSVRGKLTWIYWPPSRVGGVR